MQESIAELMRLNYRVTFYPYGEGVAVVINHYGDESRNLIRVSPAENLPELLANITARIQAGAKLPMYPSSSR